MNDPESNPDAPATKPAKKSAKPVEDNRTARIRTLHAGVKAKGFTFGAKHVVAGVPFAHAEYLVSKGEAEILEVS